MKKNVSELTKIFFKKSDFCKKYLSESTVNTLAQIATEYFMDDELDIRICTKCDLVLNWIKNYEKKEVHVCDKKMLKLKKGK